MNSINGNIFILNVFCCCFFLKKSIKMDGRKKINKEVSGRMVESRLWLRLT